jgi:hypothetical protein
MFRHSILHVWVWANHVYGTHIAGQNKIVTKSWLNRDQRILMCNWWTKLGGGHDQSKHPLSATATLGTKFIKILGNLYMMIHLLKIVIFHSYFPYIYICVYIYMGYIWDIYGIYMGYIWDIYGIYIYIICCRTSSILHHIIFGPSVRHVWVAKKKGPSLVPQVFHVHWSFGRWSLVWLLNKIYDLYVFWMFKSA